MPTAIDQKNVNYDEHNVPSYTLPDALLRADGTRVEDANAWRQRRDEILELFRHHVYGRTPAQIPNMHHDIFDNDATALNGLATRRQVTIRFGDDPSAPSMDLLLYLPNEQPRPTPVFVGLNFFGNHTVHPDPSIRLSTRWMRASEKNNVVNHRATEASRGVSRDRWCVEDVIRHGYGLATAYCGDLALDDPTRVNNIRQSFNETTHAHQAGDAWGAVAVWAWGLSRALDYLETEADVDARRVIVMGHSRLGKAALWTGAQDERFAAVISNNSGCTGAALSRRCFGETVAAINAKFPHWFCENYRSFDGREHALPIDQHMLVALQAPRPVMVCSATDDHWADPRGEFLSAYHAGDVYRLLGKDAINDDRMPEVGKLLNSTVAYRIRSGPHGVQPDDWQNYLQFADKHTTP